VAGEAIDEAIATTRVLNKNGMHVSLDHLGATQRQDEGQRPEGGTQAGHLREDALRPPDHPPGAHVVRRLMPGAHQATLPVHRAAGQVGAQVPAAIDLSRLRLRWTSVRLDIDLSRLRLFVHRGSRLLGEFPVAAGMAETPTPTGRFSVLKRNS